MHATIIYFVYMTCTSRYFWTIRCRKVFFFFFGKHSIISGDLIFYFVRFIFFMHRCWTERGTFLNFDFVALLSNDTVYYVRCTPKYIIIHPRQVSRVGQEQEQHRRTTRTHQSMLFTAHGQSSYHACTAVCAFFKYALIVWGLMENDPSQNIITSISKSRPLPFTF